MSYELAIFDMDGTILDTLDDLMASLNFALKTHGYPPRTRQQVRAAIGDGVRMLVTRSLPGPVSQEELERVLATFTQHYALNCANVTRPYAGIIPLLEGLRAGGVLTAVVSNKTHSAVVELCDRYFTGLFDVAVGNRPGLARKPSPDSVNLVLQQLNVSASSSVYLGDTEVDLATAKAAGMGCIACAWGFRGRQQLESLGARHVIDQPSQARALIARGCLDASGV